jgi:hypothetical protein
MTIHLDDKLFTSAISGYREAFLVQHSHLSESQRNQLWIEQLSRFIPASNDGDTNWQYAGSLRKRTRQDATPRTLPCSDSGLPQAKRRATVCVTLVTCSNFLCSALPALSSPNLNRHSSLD